MQIQNQALAGVTLRMRSGKETIGDARGIFEADEEDAEFLLSVDPKNWRLVDGDSVTRQEAVSKQHAAVNDAAVARELELEELAKAQRVAAELALAAPPVDVRADEKAADETLQKALDEQRENQAQIAAGDGKPVPTDEAEEVDLDKMDRDGLLLLAAKYEVKVDKRWSDQRLRDELNKELFEEGQ